MKIKLFSTSLDVDDDQEAEINNFLDSVRVISKQIVCLDRLDPPRWAVCIVYESPTSMTSVVMPTRRLNSLKSSGLRKGKERIDYRELLSERDFSIFLDLKKLRKELAVEQGYQEFVIFTNEQLYELVKMPILSLEEMKKIPGIGDSRAEKYGEKFLTLLRASRSNVSEGADTPKVEKSA